MRYRTILSAIVILMGCSNSPVTRNEAPAVSPAIVDFLLASAAADFHEHRPPDPARFRDVRVGHIITTEGEPRYRLCGSFLPKQAGGNGEWTPFVTIQTSGYEQYIGRQAAGFCQDASILWDDVGDLSDSLQNRFNSL